MKDFLARLSLKCQFQSNNILCAIYLKTRVNITLLLIRIPSTSNLFSSPLKFELTRFSCNI